MIHGSLNSAMVQVVDAQNEARTSEKFMSVVWFVDEKGVVHCKKTTWQFPTDKLAEAEVLLHNMIQDELHPPRRPLPLAEAIAKMCDPMRRMPTAFGHKGPAEDAKLPDPAEDKEPKAEPIAGQFSLEAGAAMNEGKTIAPAKERTPDDEIF
jgi:hypothetical protein